MVLAVDMTKRNTRIKGSRCFHVMTVKNKNSKINGSVKRMIFVQEKKN